MFVPPQSSYIEILTPNVMYLEVGPWGGDKVMGGGVLLNGISAL